MNTVEIRADEGGADAEAFAVDLTAAIQRGLSREGIDAERYETLLSFDGKTPQWL